MEIIRKQEIESALNNEYRQYLSGHLKYEQPFLSHIDDDIEVGISYYKEYKADKPHVHPVCTEHGYVLQGRVKIKLLDGSNTEYELSSGDYFVIRPGIPYASKNYDDTRVLFIKSPAQNDKTLIEVDDETAEWLSSWQ